MREDYDPDKYYFITVRHPETQYSSLYRYGLGDNKGFVYRSLVNVGERIYMMLKIRDLMTGWNLCWMKNVECLGEGYEKVSPSLNLGFMSFRYLCYATLHPHRLLDIFQRNKGCLTLVNKTT